MNVSREILIGYRTPGILLVFVLTLGVLLTGCGHQGAGNASNAATTQPNEATSNPKPNVARAAAAEIDEDEIRANLAYLTGASPAPLAGGATTISERGSEDGRRTAAEYMKESFEEIGIPARILEFTSGNRRGFNVEATLQGTKGQKHLWVTAHLDSVYNAGAEDDASGLVSILSTAKALRQFDPEHTVHFVAYDLEEVGLVGSTIYLGSIVSSIRNQERDRAIIGNLHSDMIGYDDGGEPDVVLGICGERSNPIGRAVLRASEMISSPIKLTEDCLGRSDHQNFWDMGLPAAVMTDSAKYDRYPWYHAPGDTIDKVNIPYLRSMIQLNAATTALLASSRNGG